jgi:hypothetical protein
MGMDLRPAAEFARLEVLEPLLHLHRVDDANPRVDAERCEILDVRHVVGLKRRGVEQEFKPKALALGREALAVLDRITRLLQEL